MRIDLLTTELRDGGAERCLTHLAIGLTADGHRVRVISIGPLPTEAPRNVLVDRLGDKSIPVISIDCASSSAFLQAYGRLKRLWQHEPPQLVQTFLFHANVLGAMLAKKSGVPVAIAGIRVAEHRPLRLWLERRAVRRMQGIVCVSEGVAEFTAKQLRPQPSCFVKVIPNAVDVSRFDGVKPFPWDSVGLKGSGPVVLVLGRLAVQKGTDQMLRMAGPLLDRCPQVRLAIVGEGPLLSEVRTVVRDLPEGRAVHIPWSDAVPSLLAASDLLWLNSRYEGMPNVVLEAMAARKPIVATDVEGVRELLGNDPLPGQASSRDAQVNYESLQIVDFGNQEGTLAALERLLEDRELAAQVGIRNRLRVEAKFSVPIMLDAYRTFYSGLSSLHIYT